MTTDNCKSERDELLQLVIELQQFFDWSHGTLKESEMWNRVHKILNTLGVEVTPGGPTRQELVDEYNRGLQDGVRMNTVGETAFIRAKLRSKETECMNLKSVLLGCREILVSAHGQFDVTNGVMSRQVVQGKINDIDTVLKGIK